MGDLHEALTTLRPIDWDELPKDTPSLNTYITAAFTAAETIINSVPPMPDTGTTFSESTPYFSTPNQANEAKDIVASQARPHPPHQSHQDLQKQWGKAVRLNAKENSLHVALYKMAGHDRRGAWFARRSVHEGIGFGKFKAAMLREFPESLLVEGAPGAGAKRGLGAERRIEQIDLEGGGESGRLEVYQLSAQMPPPVSPREFLALLVSSDDVLTAEKSGIELPDGSKHVPRHFVMMSRPTSHDDVPPRSNFVRGQYESVEIIREIPLHKSESAAGGGDPEINPVEWIMITRSDPGGGIPRFMVERGTPSALLGDLTKFLNWACSQDEIADRDADLELQQQTSQRQTEEQSGNKSTGEQPLADPDHAEEAAKTTAREAVAPVAVAAEQAQQPKIIEAAAQQKQQQQQQQSSDGQDEPRATGSGSGMVSNIANAFEAGITAYAPVSISNYVHSHLHPEAQQIADPSDSESTSDDDDYLSADELRRLSTASEHRTLSPGVAALSTENVSLTSGISTSELSTPMETDSKKTGSSSSSTNLNRHDKELRKIALKREKLESDLAKKRSLEEAKFKQSQEKEQSAQDKAKESMDRELEKAQERHRKNMEKLEAKRAKEAAKAEEKRRKKDDAARLSLVARERDELREELDLWKRENGLLSSQVEALQRENTALANKLGKLNGPEVLKAVLEEASAASSGESGRLRSNTTRSGESGLTVPSSSGASSKSG